MDFFVEMADKEGGEELRKKIESIDWETKFYGPGLPPKPEFDTSNVDVCYSLVDKFKDEVCSLFRSMPLPPMSLFQALLLSSVI